MLALAVAVAVPARADNHAVIDQVTLEPSSLGGQRLRIYLTALSLQGQVLEVGEAGTPRVSVDGRRLDLPYALGTYGEMKADTAIVVLVQAGFDFTDVLPVIGDALDNEVLANAGDRTQVAILTYGETLGAGKLGSLRAARSRATKLLGDGSIGEPVLLDQLERAIHLLQKAVTKPEGRPLRKMVVIVGDGRDVSADRDRVTRIGKRAGRAGIRIHSMAYSPKDIRRPLLLLGELSKQSLGTFRWIRGAKADSWGPAFHQLAAELFSQTTITMFLPAEEDLSGRKLKVQLVGRAELTAVNEVRIPDVSCNGQTCEAGMYCAADRCVAPRTAARRGVLGWILLIGGIALGVIVVLGVIGFILTKRQELAANVGVPTAPPIQGQVAQVPNVAVPSRPPVSQPPSNGPRLYVVNGPFAGREFPLKHGFFVGKTAGCDLLIDDGYTSGHHAQFVMQGAGYRLFDYGSTNGTFVNGQRVQDATLEHGASIRIGSTELKYLAS